MEAHESAARMSAFDDSITLALRQAILDLVVVPLVRHKDVLR